MGLASQSCVLDTRDTHYLLATMVVNFYSSPWAPQVRINGILETDRKDQ